MPYSPLGHGFLTGTIRSPEELADDDWRKTNPRFTEGNFEKNLRIVDEVQAVASEVDATPAQVALAWLLAQGDDIAPIPGTKRVSRVEENTAADAIELSVEQIARLIGPSDLRVGVTNAHARTRPEPLNESLCTSAGALHDSVQCAGGSRMGPKNSCAAR